VHLGEEENFSPMHKSNERHTMHKLQRSDRSFFDTPPFQSDTPPPIHPARDSGVIVENSIVFCVRLKIERGKERKNKANRAEKRGKRHKIKFICLRSLLSNIGSRISPPSPTRRSSSTWDHLLSIGEPLPVPPLVLRPLTPAEHRQQEGRIF